MGNEKDYGDKNHPLSNNISGQSGVNNINDGFFRSNKNTILTTQDQNKIAGLFMGFIVEKGKGEYDMTQALHTRFLREEFLSHIKECYAGMLVQIQQTLGREISVHDLGFLEAKSSQLATTYDESLYGIQVTYYDAIKGLLEDKKNAFSKNVINSFKNLVGQIVTKKENKGQISVGYFMHQLHLWRNEVSLSAMQAQKIDEIMKGVGLEQVMHTIKKHNFLQKDEIHTLSATGVIPENTILISIINQMGLSYFDEQRTLQERVGSRIEQEAKHYDSEGFGEYVTQGNQEAIQLAQELQSYGWQLHKCSNEFQKKYFNFMKKMWMQTTAYKQTYENLVLPMNFLTSDEFHNLIDSLFDPQSDTIVITLPNGERISFVSQKEIVSTNKKYLQGSMQDTLDALGSGIPMRVVMADGETDLTKKQIARRAKNRNQNFRTYNLSNPRGISELLHYVALHVGYEKQKRQDSISDMIDNTKTFEQEQTASALTRAFDAIKDIQPQNITLDEDDEYIRIPEKPLPIFSYEQVVENSELDDTQRVIKAIQLLNEYMGNEWFLSRTKKEQETIKKAILEAHYSCVGEQGTIPGHAASVFFYTKAQLREKANILIAAGLSRDQISVLFRSGISGTPPEKLLEELGRQRHELLQKKIVAKDLYDKALKDRLDFEKNKIIGGTTIKQLSKQVALKGEEIERKKEALKDREKKKNEPWWLSATDAEKALYEQQTSDLAENIQDLLESFQAEKEKLVELQSDDEYQGLVYAEQQISHEFDEIKKEIRKLDSRIKSTESLTGDEGFFDWSNKTEAERKEYYDRKKIELGERKKSLQDQKEELEKIKMTITDSESEKYKQITNEINWIDGEIKATQRKLDHLEVAYKNANKNEKKEEFKKKEKDEKEKKQEDGETEGLRKLQETWNNIQGYRGETLDWKKVKNGERPQLFLMYGEKQENVGTFGGSLIRCEIVGVDEKTGQMEVAFFGVSGPLVQTINGQETKIEGMTQTFDAESFKKFLSQPQWTGKLRMPPKPVGGHGSMKAWGEKLKQDLLNGQYSFEGSTEKWINKFVAQVDFSSIQKQDPSGENKPEKIVYMGRAQTTDAGPSKWHQGDWYKVDFSREPIIRLTQPFNPGTPPIEMSYDTFLLFSADKELNALSQEDVDRVNEKIGVEKGKDYVDEGVSPGTQDESVLRKNQKRGLFGWNWITIHAAKTQWKNIMGAYKKKIESWTKDDEEKAASLFANSWFANKIAGAGIPLLSEVIMDNFVGPAASEGDKKKKEKIDKYAKEPEDYKDTTPGGAFDYIKAVLFENPDKARSNLLRVAGYFQYVCSKGEGLYPRSLAKYEGQGLWIRMLCGATWQNNYLKWYAEQLRLSKLYPDDLDIRNRILYSEAYYLSNVINGKSFEGSGAETHVDGKKRGDLITEQFGKIYSKAWMGGIYDTFASSGYGTREKIESKANDLMKNEKENFSSLSGEVYGNFEAKSVAGGFAHLIALAGKMKGNEDYYTTRGNAMLYPILTNLTSSVTDTAVKASYVGLSRKYGFPLGLYGWNAPKNGRDELIKMLVMFEKHMGYPGTSIAKLVEELRDKKDKDSLEAFRKKLVNGKDGRWDNVGKKFLNYMTNPAELFSIETALANKIEGEPIDATNPDIAWVAGLSHQQAEDFLATIREYIDTKLVDTDLSGGGKDAKLDAISLKKNIWALSAGFMTEVMWNSRRGRQFDQSVIEQVPGLWNSLTRGVQGYVKKASTGEGLSKREVQFLMNKFGALTQGKIPYSEGFLHALYAPHPLYLAPGGGKGKNNGGGTQQTQNTEPRECDPLARYILKSLDDKKFITGENLPSQIRENIEAWMELFRTSSFKKHLAPLIAEGKIKSLEERQDQQKRMNKNQLLGESLSEQAEEHFKKEARKMNAQGLAKEYGNIDIYDYDEDDEDNNNPWF